MFTFLKLKFSFGHVECSLDKPAENFSLKLGKFFGHSLKIFRSNSETFMNLYLLFNSFL